MTRNKPIAKFGVTDFSRYAHFVEATVELSDVSFGNLILVLVGIVIILGLVL